MIRDFSTLESVFSFKIFPISASFPVEVLSVCKYDNIDNDDAAHNEDYACLLKEDLGP